MPRPGAGTSEPAGFDAEAALAHLRDADPVIAGLDRRHEISFEPDPDRDDDHYAALVRAIVGQQLSTTVARVDLRAAARALRRAPADAARRSSTTTPRSCARPSASRARRRASCARSPSTSQSGELDLDHVSTLPDDELIRELTAVKGIGDWSAHMFLMFQLQRPDVLAVGRPRRAARRAARLRARRSCRTAPSSSCSPSPGGPTARRRAACCGGRSTTSRAG